MNKWLSDEDLLAHWNISPECLGRMVLYGNLKIYKWRVPIPGREDVRMVSREAIDIPWEPGTQFEADIEDFEERALPMGGPDRFKNLMSIVRCVTSDIEVRNSALLQLLPHVLFNGAEVDAKDRAWGSDLSLLDKEILMHCPLAPQATAPQSPPEHQHDTAHAPAPAEQTDPEAFIRSLSVAFLSETEVSIKVGNKKAENYTREDMGFKRKRTLWPLFIKVLQNHEFHVGIYSADKDPIKNRNYYRLVKQLSNFSKQFTSFLNDKYSASLPKNVFKNMKGEDRDGTYKPIFQIVDNSDTIHSTDIKKMSKEETINKLTMLSEQLKREKDEPTKDRLLREVGHYAEYAKKRGWITEQQLRYLITPPDEDVSPEDAMSFVDSAADKNKF